MGKAMSIGGLVVAGLLVVVFAADLAIGVPFGGYGKLTDAGFLISAALLAYLGWNAFRDSR
jgi:hypothetical protein